MPSCANFDIDLKTNVVECVQTGFGSSDGKSPGRGISRMSRRMKNPASPITNLQEYFGSSGVP